MAKEPVPLRHPPTGDLIALWKAVVHQATSLPGVRESRSYGTPALKVRGKLVARLRSEAEGGLALRCEMDKREVLLKADPEAFYITDHYLEYPMILIDLAQIDAGSLADLLEDAWRLVAPTRMVAEFDSH